MVDDIDAVLAKVEKSGGKIVDAKNMMKGVGLLAVIRDTGGNELGVWTPKM
jgi:predicted enzyme related to lactoylglutathione lyase